MSKRWEPILRAVTWGLVVVVAGQLLAMVFRKSPVNGLKVPVVPHWQVASEVAASAPTHRVEVRTNQTAQLTNTVATHPMAGTATNGILTSTNGALVGTNTSVIVTNARVEATHHTLLPTHAVGVTNTATPTNAVAPSNPAPVASLGNGPPRTFGAAPPSSKAPRPVRALTPLIQARIDLITQSEVLAPVFHPPPMALLGIAGRDAFIRTPSGQSTLLREGGESDGIKLLRLGTNRVLIEQGNEKKELIIFDGFGSESLLPK